MGDELDKDENVKTRRDKSHLSMFIGEDTFVITLVLCPCFLYNLYHSPLDLLLVSN